MTVTFSPIPSWWTSPYSTSGYQSQCYRNLYFQGVGYSFRGDKRTVICGWVWWPCAHLFSQPNGKVDRAEEGLAIT